MSNGIFRCKRCRTTFIEEEFDKHACTPTLKDVKRLEFDYYYFGKDEKGRDEITIKSMDGVLYTFVRREKSESDKVPYPLPPLPTNLQQPKGTPDEDNSTRLLVVLNQWLF